MGDLDLDLVIGSYLFFELGTQNTGQNGDAAELIATLAQLLRDHGRTALKTGFAEYYPGHQGVLGIVAAKEIQIGGEGGSGFDETAAVFQNLADPEKGVAVGDQLFDVHYGLESAVDLKGSAGDIAGLFRAEVLNTIGDILWLAKLAGGDLFEVLVDEIFREIVDQLGADKAGQN